VDKDVQRYNDVQKDTKNMQTEMDNKAKTKIQKQIRTYREGGMEGDTRDGKDMQKKTQTKIEVQKEHAMRYKG
jgi:hypothetical protein